jgi:AraC family transcriptional regulator, regulatory protein of adaptative response / methylated-DNA-[protein]-cysteine methyltransferase
MTNLVQVSMDKILPYSSDDQRWAAVTRRDHNADGYFYYSVATTGVYCRPSCGARQPLRKNVAFHSSAEAARRAGFRPCKRCNPDGRGIAHERASIIAEACRTLENTTEPPDLDRIAGEAGMSRFHFQRVFKKVTGVTPRAYFSECRKKKVQTELSRSKTITEAIYDSGFNSNGRFYASSSQMLGMTPKVYRSGGGEQAIRFAVGQCSLGSILVASTDKGLCSILLGDDPDRLMRELQDRFPNAQLIGGDKEFERMVATVIGFVENPKQGLNLPLDVQGTAFQQRVWRALRDIPVGAIASYEEIAKKIGAPSSARAVAAACSANHLAIAIPCHRVVRKDGDVSGYRWGVDRKRALLERESVTS